MTNEEKRNVCYYKKTCTSKTCEKCIPSIEPRENCYHKFNGLCLLCGLLCDDGYKGILCENYLDKSERPSKDHIWSITESKWIIKKGKEHE